MKKHGVRFGMFVLSLLALASCGQAKPADEPAKAATLKASYISSQEDSYKNFRPAYNFYLLGFRYQTLEVYDDNTYQFSVHTIIDSGVNFDDSGDRHSSSAALLADQVFYGNYKETVDELDNTSLHYSLAKPTRYVYTKMGSQSGNVFLDTANWTDTMSKEAGLQDDKKTPLYTSGEDYLNNAIQANTQDKVVWSTDVEIICNTKTHFFDYNKTATPDLVL